MASTRTIRLRYAGQCAVCGTAMSEGDRGVYDRVTKLLVCVRCDLATPPDPFAAVAPDERGRAGASAEAEGRRRGGHSAVRWEKGAEGERIVSRVLLERSERGQIERLEDLAIPGTRANIDHIAIARSGVYVVDAKNYKGPVQPITAGLLGQRNVGVRVAGRDRSKLIAHAASQVEVVAGALAGVIEEVPSRAVLCFVGKENWGIFESGFEVDGTHIVSKRALGRLLDRPGPLDSGTRNLIARALRSRFQSALRTQRR